MLTQNVSNQKFHIINSEKISLAEPQPAAPRRAGHRIIHRNLEIATADKRPGADPYAL